MALGKGRRQILRLERMPRIGEILVILEVADILIAARLLVGRRRQGRTRCRSPSRSSPLNRLRRPFESGDEALEGPIANRFGAHDPEVFVRCWLLVGEGRRPGRDEPARRLLLPDLGPFGEIAKEL